MRQQATAVTTVVVPTYNSGAFIGLTLQSVFEQSERPAEIIVVDDGSSDHTLDLVHALQPKAPVPLRIERMPRNSGSPAGPMNRGVEISHTPYVALLEHDDVMLPDRLRLQRQALDQFPDSCMAIGRIVEFSTVDDGPPRWKTPLAPHPDLAGLLDAAPGDICEVPARTAFRALVSGNFVHTNSNILLRRSAWDRLGGYTLEWPRNNDAEFEFRWFSACPVAMVNRPCCGYRVSAGSLYHSNKIRSLVDGQRLRLQVLRQHPEWSVGLRPRVRRTLASLAWRALRERDPATALRAWRELTFDGLRGA
jgi:glycosyltransferase involved in cell wall biosynthesis